MAAALGEELSIGLLGDTLDAPAQQAIAHGADRVYAVNIRLLAEYQPDLYLAALDALCRDVNPAGGADVSHHRGA